MVWRVAAGRRLCSLRPPCAPTRQCRLWAHCPPATRSCRLRLRPSGATRCAAWPPARPSILERQWSRHTFDVSPASRHVLYYHCEASVERLTNANISRSPAHFRGNTCSLGTDVLRHRLPLRAYHVHNISDGRRMHTLPPRCWASRCTRASSRPRHGAALPVASCTQPNRPSRCALAFRCYCLARPAPSLLIIALRPPLVGPSPLCLPLRTRSGAHRVAPSPRASSASKRGPALEVISRLSSVAIAFACGAWRTRLMGGEERDRPAKLSCRRVGWRRKKPAPPKRICSPD